MKCNEIKQLLSAYVDDELPDDMKKAVGRHVVDCAECRSLLAEQVKLREQLFSLDEMPPLPDMESAIMTAVMNTGASQKTRRWLRPVLVSAPVVLILAITLPIILPDIALSPRKVLARASATGLNVQSYRMTDNSYRYDPATKDLSAKTYKLESAVNIPEGLFYMKKESQGPDPGHVYFHEQIIIGEQVYVRGDSSIIVTSDDIQEYSPSAVITQERLDMLAKIEVLPEESIDGVECFHYRGTVDIEKYIKYMQAMREEINAKRNIQYSEEKSKFLNDMLAEMWREKTITYEFWIGKNDYIIRQSKSVFASATGELDQDSSMGILKYYDFNVPIVIEPPLDKTGELLPGWSMTTGGYFQDSENE